jgi:hypothetical protein
MLHAGAARVYGPDMHWATPEERTILARRGASRWAARNTANFNSKARKTSSVWRFLPGRCIGRVPALVKLKYELMAESPFGYFRGAVPVMAADLAVLPNTGIVSQLCGDAHVRNLGAYAAPDGRLVFDINDFDETIRGPFEWDLKRMAASLVLAGRGSGHKDARLSAPWSKCIERYARRCAPLPRCRALEVGRFQVHRLGHGCAYPRGADKGRARHAAAHAWNSSPSRCRTSRAPRRFKRIEADADARQPRHRPRPCWPRWPYREMLEPQRQHLLVVLPARGRGLQSGGHRIGGLARLLRLL